MPVESEHLSRSPAHLIHLSALTLMQLIVGYPCTSLAASDTGLVKCLSNVGTDSTRESHVLRSAEPGPAGCGQSLQC